VRFCQSWTHNLQSRFFVHYFSIAILTVQLVPTSGEEKAREFTERVTSGHLTHLLGP
jgi:hypothetical protein